MSDITREEALKVKNGDIIILKEVLVNHDKIELIKGSSIEWFELWKDGKPLSIPLQDIVRIEFNQQPQLSDDVEGHKTIVQKCSNTTNEEIIKDEFEELLCEVTNTLSSYNAEHHEYEPLNKMWKLFQTQASEIEYYKYIALNKVDMNIELVDGEIVEKPTYKQLEEKNKKLEMAFSNKGIECAGLTSEIETHSNDKIELIAKNAELKKQLNAIREVVEQALNERRVDNGIKLLEIKKILEEE